MNKAQRIVYWDYELEIERNIDSTPGMRKNGLINYNNTEFVLDYLKKNNIKNCFAVVGYNAEEGKLPFHASKQIRRMAEEGHEVASHSYTHRDISQMGYNEFVDELKKSKIIIEKVKKEICISFVQTRNITIEFVEFNLSLRNNYMIKRKKLSFDKILKDLVEVGCKTTSQYYKLFIKKS